MLIISPPRSVELPLPEENGSESRHNAFTAYDRPSAPDLLG